MKGRRNTQNKSNLKIQAKKSFESSANMTHEYSNSDLHHTFKQRFGSYDSGAII